MTGGGGAAGGDRGRRGTDGRGRNGADGRRNRADERAAPRRRLHRWLLVDADRRAVAALLAAGFFLALVALGAVDPSPLAATMTRTDPVETLFQAYVAAVVTGVTLVITINQLVLSQELGAVGDQRDRMDGAMQFRRDAEAVLGTAVSPADPAAFARELLAAVARRAEDVGETVAGGGAAEAPAGDGDDASIEEETEAFVDSVTASAAATDRRLAGARFGTFEVVGATLGFDYSALLHEARRLRAAGVDADAIDDLTTALELFGVTREHLKTLYFQWELVDLSRALAYLAVPALVVASGVLLYLDAAAVRGTTLGVADAVWTVSAASTVAVLPFVTLLSYVLRVATVAKRTLAIGPFVLDATDRG